MSTTAVAFVGLPGAGKTTYLAAFWAVCRAAGTDRAYEVTQFPSAAARAYLQKIAEEWFEGRVVERNASTSWLPIELTLLSPDGLEVELRVPDLSGEAFRDAAAERHIDERIAELIGGCDLVLFFVNAASASTPMYLTDLAPAKAENEATVVDFDAKALDSDTLNAELLHLLPAMTDTPELPRPVAVVISAWDTVDALGQSPAEWLENNQPMFAQVLAEHAHRAPVTVIGVSAQGGDYATDPSVSERAAHQRPLVVTANERCCEIAAPLLWFAGLPGGGG